MTDVFTFLVRMSRCRWFRYVADFLQQDIASAIVGRFRCSLQCFFAEEKSYPLDRIGLKKTARWRYDWCTNALEIFQNLKKWGCRVYAHHFGDLKRDERTVL